MTVVQWIVAAGTGLFVALVGYFQYRTARQKFALDLFERRHAIYVVVRSALGKISSRGSLDQEEEFDLGDKIEAAYFFFGDDLISYLKDFQQNVIDVNVFSAEISEIADPIEKAEAIKKVRAAKERIFKFYSEGQPLFARYMRFEESVPGGPLEYLNNLRKRNGS